MVAVMFSEEHLEAIRQVYRDKPNHGRLSEDELINELARLDVEFAEGEVYAFQYLHGGSDLYRWGPDQSGPHVCSTGHRRPQTQREHGPAVADLVEAAEYAKDMIAGCNSLLAYHRIKKALDAYNARHPKEDK